ncbi:MAG TPA: glycosyltransferase 87 family protein [Candidatus Hodarchaeales archaeon]|nr:glycosyltransferase 87 family protein [Candidatus Hodarchaeales archaeon]
MIHIAVLSSVLQSSKPVIWPFHYDTIHRIGGGADFFAVYHAAVNLRNRISPYERNDDGITPYYYPFRYLPVVGFAAQVLIFLNPWFAYLLWILVLESLMVFFLYVLYKRIHQKSLWKVICVILLLSSPYFLEVYMGQFTFAAVALCLLSILLPRGNILFSLSVLLKSFPLIAAPALLTKRHYRSHVVTAIILLLVTCLPYFYLNKDDLHSFLYSNLQPVGGVHSGNYGFVMLIHLIATDLDSSVLLDNSYEIFSVLRLLILSSSILCVFLAKKRDIDLSVSTLLLAHFVTYQHVWEHHISGIILIGVVLVAGEGLKKLDTIFLLLCVILLALPTPYILFDEVKDPDILDPAFWWPRYASYFVLLPKVIPTVLIFGWCIRKLFRETSSPFPDPKQNQNKSS